MAYIKCPICDSLVNEDCERCVHCNSFIKYTKNKETKYFIINGNEFSVQSIFLLDIKNYVKNNDNQSLQNMIPRLSDLMNITINEANVFLNDFIKNDFKIINKWNNYNSQNQTNNKIKDEKEQNDPIKKWGEQYEKELLEYEQELEKLSAEKTIYKHKPILNEKIMLGIFFIAIAIFVAIFLYTMGKPDDFAMEFLYAVEIFFIIVFGLGGIVYVKEGIESLKKTRRLYNKYKNDTKKLKLELVRQRKVEEAYQEFINQYSKKVFDEKKKNKAIYNPRCPYCGSSDIKKITTGDRVVSTALVGVASSKIGKQWHCNKCKSNF